MARYNSYNNDYKPAVLCLNSPIIYDPAKKEFTLDTNICYYDNRLPIHVKFNKLITQYHNISSGNNEIDNISYRQRLYIDHTEADQQFEKILLPILHEENKLFYSSSGLKYITNGSLEKHLLKIPILSKLTDVKITIDTDSNIAPFLKNVQKRILLKNYGVSIGVTCSGKYINTAFSVYCRINYDTSSARTIHVSLAGERKSHKFTKIENVFLLIYKNFSKEIADNIASIENKIKKQKDIQTLMDTFNGVKSTYDSCVCEKGEIIDKENRLSRGITIRKGNTDLYKISIVGELTKDQIDRIYDIVLEKDTNPIHDYQFLRNL